MAVVSSRGSSAASLRQAPVIVVHAITGSVLVDNYPLPSQPVWDPGLLSVSEYPRLAVHPDDLQREALQPALIAPQAAVSIIYRDFVEALRHDLSATADQPTPVFVFNYDWRQDNLASAAALGDFVTEVIARTNLLRHYGRQCRQVDLVGHSMGGLVIGAYLAGTADAPVRKVVTLGTPFRGAVDALAKLATGESSLVGRSSNRERESARLLPALYQLVPHYPAAFTDEGDQPLDIYDPGNWQRTVIDSIAEHVRRFTTDAALQKSAQARRRQAVAQLGTMLAAAKKLHDRLSTLDPKRALRSRRAGAHPDWLVLVGDGCTTRFQARRRAAAPNYFDFRAVTAEEVERLQPPRARRLEATLLGDGTVPRVSAEPPWADAQEVVRVTEGDFGPFEARDRVLAAAVGLHAALPLMNAVQRRVIGFLLGRPSPVAD